MTLQELRFIVALAREKHFHKASAACFVSQPTLSIAIRKIEKELKVTLFERNKNDVHVTPVGEDIVLRAKRILSEVEGIKEAALSDRDHLKGSIKLGAIYTVGPYLLPALITELNSLAPDLSIEINEDYTANLRTKLLAGELDAILISYPFKVPGLFTRTLYKEPFEVLMPANHALARRKTVSDSALTEHNVLMLGEGHCFRDQMLASCPSCFSLDKTKPGIHWRTVEGGSLETIRHMVASGVGVTILPKTAANVGSYAPHMLTTRPLKSSLAKREVAIAWRASYPRFKVIDIISKAISDSEMLKNIT